MKIITVPLSKLHANPGQLERRHNSKHTVELRTQIEKCGQLAPIVLLPRAAGGYEIVDGHRRVTALRDLDSKTAYAVVLDGDAVISDEGIPALTGANGGSRPFSGTENFAAWVAASDRMRPRVLEAMASKSRKQIQFLIDVYGEAGLLSRAKAGKAKIALAEYIRGIANFFAQHGLDPVALPQLGDWILDNKFGYAFRGFRKIAQDNKAAVRKLRSRVVKNIPFPGDEWFCKAA